MIRRFDAGIEIEIASHGSLLSRDGQKLVTALREVFAQAVPEWICLQQFQACADNSQEWIQELEEDLLLEELFQRVLALRQLFREILSSPAQVVYVLHSSCEGSYWDLARACHHRMAFGKSSMQFGYSVPWERLAPLSYGIIPLPELVSMDVPAATAAGIIHVYGGRTSSPSLWRKYCSSFAPRKKELPAKLPLLSFEKLLTQEPPIKQTDSLSYMRQLSKKYSGKYFEEVHLARVILQPRTETDELKESTISTTDMRIIYISLEYLPPLAAIKSLLDGGCKLVFWALQAGTLRYALNRLYTSLEKNKHYKNAWHEQVVWWLGSPNSYIIWPQLYYYREGYLKLRVGKQQLTVLALNGCRFNAELGVLESGTSPEDFWPLKYLGVKVLQTNSRNIWLSDVLRLRVFGELVDYAISCGADLQKVLHDCPWEFFHDRSRWEDFLLANTVSASPLLPLPYLAESAFRNADSLLAWVKTKKARNNLQYLPANLRKHLLIAVWAISQHLEKCGISTVYGLWQEALGAGRLQTKSFWGGAHCSEYARKHWPDLRG